MCNMNIEKLNELIQALIDFLNQNTDSTANLIEKILSSPMVSTLIGATIAAFPIILKETREKKRKQDAEIQQLLQNFYNPLLFLLKKASAYYKIFNLKAKEEYKKASKEYRTLKFFVTERKTKNDLSQADLIIFEKILDINKNITNLISQNIGYIDKDLVSKLVELSQHYEMLVLASEGKLDYQKEYEEYVYPTDIEETVEKLIQQLYSKTTSKK